MEILEGGTLIRNVVTNAQGTLGVIVQNQMNQHVGLTCHHVVFGSINDEVQARQSDGAWKKIGHVQDGSEALDVATIEITETATWEVKENRVQGKPIAKLKSSGLTQGGTIYKYGAFSKGWTKGLVLSPKKSRLMIKSKGKPLGIPGDSGSAWIHGPEPYTVCGIHYWGSDDGNMAFARNIDKVVLRFGLKTSL